MPEMFDPTLIHEWLSRSAQRFPDKTAIVCSDRQWSYKTLDQESDKLADALICLGLKPADRVVIFIDNSAETVVSMYGVLRAGGAFVILNTALKSDKLAFILDNAGAGFLITHTTKGRTILDALQKVSQKPQTIWLSPTGKLPEPIIAAGHNLLWDQLLAEAVKTSKPRIIDTDLAALIYTSGSTGRPKGVICPHGKMVSVSKSIIRYLENTPDDIILNVLSLSFGYGLYQVIMSIMFGGTVVIEKSFVYLHDVIRKIPQYKATAFPIVPTIAAMLLNLTDLSAYDFSSLRYITSAGAALPPEYTRRLRSLWPHIKIIPMHGLTECVRTCYLPADQIDQRPDSVGFAIPDCRLTIVDENGRELPAEHTGEMVVSGSNVMGGYWKDPELTAKVFRQGSDSGQTLLYTGDLFRRDREGYLYFVGRKDDMIKTRGERVSPKEIEDILLRCPGVAEAVVIGIPDAILGQVPKAFIVRESNADISENDLLQFASQNMENFMVPKSVQFIEQLPKTPNGKIDKLTLREQEHL